MERSHKYWFVILDVICILAALELSAMYLIPVDWSLLTDYTGATTFTVLIFMLSFYIMDCHNVGHEEVKDSIIRLSMGIGLGIMLTTVFFYFFENWRFPRTLFIVQMLANLLFSLGWRVIYLRFAGRIISPQRVLFLGSENSSRVRRLLREYSPEAEIIGYLGEEGADEEYAGQHLGSISDALSVVRNRNITKVIMLNDSNFTGDLAKELFNARLSGLAVDDMRSLYERLALRVPVDLINDNWLLHEDGFNLNVHQMARRAKRVFDIVVSFGLLLVLWPILLLTALAIKMESPGPVIYSQRRVGLQGKVFTVYKLRSMSVDAEKDGAQWAVKADPRVTKVGRFIRKTRIDELPQLFNVFIGDMSLIGPRPERPEFVSELEAQIPYFYVRHSVKPGITGWAQVLYPYGSSIEDARYKLEYDFYYIKHLSILLELKIFLKTIGVVLFPKGAR